jgi:apolipoprotein N-acyltransferase
MNWLGFSNTESLVLLSFAWLGLSLFEALFPALLGILFYKIKNIFSCDWLLITLLWIIMEWAQGSGPLGLPWSRLANSQYTNIYIIQGASLFGSVFVSGLLVLGNALIACYLYNRSSHKYIIGFLLIFIINFSYGYYRINSKENYTETANISIIQTNINSKEKWISSSVNNILDTYIELTQLACNNPTTKIDTVIWSETAIPITLANHKDILEKCHQLSNSTNTTILVGSFDSIDNDTFNTIFKFSPFSDNTETYYKQNLVPFGEYLPLRSVFEKSIPILSNLNAGTSDLTAGEKNNIFNTNNSVIANLICFDSIFPEIARQQVLEGANIIAVESNDSWFNKTAAKHEHLSQAVLRAVENNRYVMRCANGSISAAISATGQIVSALKSESDGYINYEVPLIPDKTLYTQLGDCIVFISMLIIVVLLITNILLENIIYPISKKVRFFWSMLVKK